MLKSIVFLLVLICFLTTPTRAYEASNQAWLTNTPQIERINTENLIGNQKTTHNNSTSNLCQIAIKKAETTYQIKNDLLQTIALVESGRWDSTEGKRVAWPWTVQANGKGHYYKTKQEAIIAIKQMQSQGITNIDVGCMQINLKYHGSQFSSLDEALDPENNVSYSAKFLRNLYQRNQRNWQKTAMQYHSKNLHKGINYKNKLEQHYAKYISTKTSLF